MKKLIMWCIFLMVIGKGYAQEERLSIIPLNTSNKWIYTSYLEDNRFNRLDSNFTEIKEITGDTVIGGINYISVRITTIKDSILTISPELWRVDSTSFYIFDTLQNREFTLYDTTVTHDSLWGNGIGWLSIRVYTEVWWNEIREIQEWEEGIDFHGFFWVRRFRTARDLGPLYNYYEEGYGPDLLYISNITGATINGIPYGNPAPPLDVIAIPDTHEVELSWRQNSEIDILRYRIYSKILPDSIALIDSTVNADTMKTVTGLISGQNYYFYITAVDSEMNESNFSVRVATQTLGLPTSIGEYNRNVIQTIKLFQNFPNPFNPTTNIGYAIGNKQFISLKVYDLLGRKIATLVNGEKPAGAYTVDFDASGLSSGIYFYQLQAGDFVETKKMILMH